MPDTTENAAARGDLSQAPWLANPSTQAVFVALVAAGHEARAVGGVVRNALLGLPVTDIDIATPARPDAVVAACRAAGLATIPTGLAHGTVTVRSGGVSYEVTTLRADIATDGRHATVAFTTDWAGDASRRDFTMNALYCDAAGRIHDPLGGYPDVIARRVRFIGDADQRIGEDYLRILRFFRFHAQLGHGDIDSAGRDACIRGRAGLGRISAERIHVELVKLLLGGRALDAVMAMSGCGLLTDILGVAPRPGILTRLIAAEASCQQPPDAVLRLAALTLAVTENVGALARRLKLSNWERQALIVIDQPLAQHMAALDPASARRELYKLGLDHWRRAVLGFLAAAPTPEGLAQARMLLDLAASWPIPRLPVKGADLLALGITPGPEFGAILAEIEHWWVANDFPAEPQVRDRLAAMTEPRKG